MRALLFTLVLAASAARAGGRDPLWDPPNRGAAEDLLNPIRLAQAWLDAMASGDREFLIAFTATRLGVGANGARPALLALRRRVEMNRLIAQYARGLCTVSTEKRPKATRMPWGDKLERSIDVTQVPLKCVGKDVHLVVGRPDGTSGPLLVIPVDF